MSIRMARAAVIPRVLAYAGHYHHANGGVDWLVDIAMRSVIYSVVGRLLRSLTLPEALAIAAVAIVAFLAYRGRRI